jgi:flagellar biosynthesis/type III secretory pathway protein FliH
MTIRIIPADEAVALKAVPMGPLPPTVVRPEDLAALRQQARAEGVALAVAETAEMLRAAQEQREQVLAAAEAELAGLALALARRIVGRELSVNPDALSEMVCHAIGTLRGRRELVLRVHPAAYDALEGRRAEIEAAAGGVIRFLADPSRKPNGVSVDTESGTLDCDLDTQIDVLAQRMGVSVPASSA